MLRSTRDRELGKRNQARLAIEGLQLQLFDAKSLTFFKDLMGVPYLSDLQFVNAGLQIFGIGSMPGSTVFRGQGWFKHS